MGNDDDVTATSDRTSRRRRNGDRPEAPACFQANCRILADAIAKTGTRLRIALTAETGAEPFLIHASYDIRSRMQVCGEAETERAITSGLESRRLDVPGVPGRRRRSRTASLGRAGSRHRRDSPRNRRALAEAPTGRHRFGEWQRVNDEGWLVDDLVDPDVYAKGVDEGWTDIELYRLIVRQLQRSFHSGTEADQQTMLANPPHLTSTKWDAAMAAAIEHAALTHGYDAPAWVDEPERFLPEPVKLTGFETDSDLAWQPGAFLRRGVSINSRDLDARTGDGRQWTAELRKRRPPRTGASRVA